MPNRIEDLLKQITLLEDELGATLRERQQKISYHLKGKRVEFEQSISQSHQKLKTSLLHTLFIDRPQNIITAPIIYGMAIPLVLMDILISFYQYTCFPIYGVARVKRRAYFIYDRDQLRYLNIVQKINCHYCAYGNGLMAYASEIIARTEQYFCPIKHATKRLGAHPRYLEFSEFGDAENFKDDLTKLRKELREVNDEQIT
ncbi:hypothetical protein [Thiomicrospira pelophila]|uniref:hypothetical protein n=1 Tax=Thiomicrospira pelophila TaxID=934 RepID=UPI0004A6C560|nr:hypothetical protein [Thiomicrospira pelophila]